ncbi:MAG: D-alanyl-D-alanine carboxypeptidase/D-alanyl-D-alanine-endopeptidase [Armatimonadetes bacterium]|nr:D-alanyl-D-alanine carboxypeptidase/D-alanyl-D-alanine-endopeptidase [Armatimonadota bacterium]
MTGYRPRTLALTAFVLYVGALASAPAESPWLERRLDAVFADAKLASASVGCLVVDLRTGETLYERDPDRALMPASNMKLVTSLAALRFLGPSFRYSTTLCAASPGEGSPVIDGDLYLRGSGDPTLRHEDLTRLAEEIAAQGVRTIRGDIVADSSCFPGPPLGLGWAWDDETYAYSAQVCGLGVDGNTVRAEIVGGERAGDPCRLDLTPPGDHLSVDPGCVTGAADAPRPVVFRRRAQNVVAATGPLPAGARASAVLSLEEPDLYAARLLHAALMARDIAVEGACRRGETPADASALVTHESASLRDLLAAMNVPSDNGIAEALLRTVPLAEGRPGTASEATGMIEQWLPDIDVPVHPLRLCDGSGLSRLNLLTPRAIVGLLTYAAGRADLCEPLLASLPVAGASGTLARRMRSTAAEGRVHAKTGSLWGVSALAGYVTAPDGCAVTFSILMNNYGCEGAEVRELQDRACVALTRFVDAQRP